jgi:DNA polymerase V
MPKGGARIGAGRPKGQGKFGSRTKPVRIPEDCIDAVMRFVQHQGYRLPLYNCAVSAGFPSPVDDDIEKTLDLNEHLIKNASATFFLRVAGDSMIGAGIYEDDILVVDRSLEAQHGKVVIAALDGQLTVKRLYKKNNSTKLIAENSDYPDIKLNEESNIVIWGIVTTVLHSV